MQSSFPLPAVVHSMTLSQRFSASKLVVRFMYREPKSLLNKSLSLSSLLYLKTPGLVSKPRGVIRKSSNLENHGPSVAHDHTLLAVTSLGGTRQRGELSKLH